MRILSTFPGTAWSSLRFTPPRRGRAIPRPAEPHLFSPSLPACGRLSDALRHRGIPPHNPPQGLCTHPVLHLKHPLPDQFLAWLVPCDWIPAQMSPAHPHPVPLRGLLAAGILRSWAVPKLERGDEGERMGRGRGEERGREEEGQDAERGREVPHTL